MRIIHILYLILFLSFQSCSYLSDRGIIPKINTVHDYADNNDYKSKALLLNTIAKDVDSGKSLKKDSTDLLNAVVYFNAIGDKEKEQESLIYLGLVYEQYSDYSSSLICFREALELATKINDTRNMSYLHSKIGVLYSQDYDIAESADHLKVASELLKHQMIDETNTNYLLQAGLTYLYLSEAEHSLSLFEPLYTSMLRADNRYPVLLRNMSVAYIYEEKWEEALRCLTAIPSCTEPEKAAVDKLIAIYIYMHTGQKEKLDSTRIALEELLPRISNLNIHQSFYQIDSDYHMQEGDLKKALMQLKRSLVYKDRIQEHLSKGTPDELYAIYQIDKLQIKYGKLEHTVTLIAGLVFVTILFLILFYLWYRRKKRLHIFDLEAKLETLECIVEKNKNSSSQIAGMIIRDLEITKRIALLRSQQINTNQTFLEKLNKVLTIDDKNPFMIEWAQFYDDVDKLYKGFYKYLCTSYPDLNEKELQLCCLMRVGFKTDEIAAVWSQSVYSVQKCRSSVRKKMHTGEGADIILFIEEKMNAL